MNHSFSSAVSVFTDKTRADELQHKGNILQFSLISNHSNTRQIERLLEKKKRLFVSNLVESWKVTGAPEMIRLCYTIKSLTSQ